MFALLLACAPEPTDTPDPLPFCDGPTRFVWDTEGALNVFPDDHRTVPADTTTGRRIALETATTPFLQEYPKGFVDIFDALSTLDGWGISAGMWFQADAPLTTLPEIHVVAGGREFPVDTWLTDADRTLMVLPRFPLPEASEVTVVVTTDPDDPQCLAPAQHTRDLLDPATMDAPEQADRYRTALSALDIDPTHVAAMSVYTTQSATRLSRLVASDIEARATTFEPGTCYENATWRQCDGAVPVQDYREADHVVPADSAGQPYGAYDLPTRVWLPLTGATPYPTVFCGHGLGGDRGQCTILADLAAPEGIAVVAVDAVEHGDHPGRTEADFDILDDLMILAISVDPPGLDGLRLRDNFRQSAWDKLQVVRAVEEGADVDGDGTVDLDPERMAYVGVSLGAIMGPEPMALSDRFDGGVLLVGGARISSIIRDSVTFGVLVDLMRPPGTSDGDVERFFPVLQTVIDAGDPAAFAPHVVADRFDAAMPSLLDGMVLADEIVPNSTNEALARALGVPGVGTEVWPVADLAFAAAPARANLASGATGGVLQFAQVQETDGGEWVVAEHDNLHESVTGQEAMVGFLRAVLSGETPVIEEPARP